MSTMPGLPDLFSEAHGPVASSSTQTSPAATPSWSPRHLRGKGGVRFSRPRWSTPPRVLLVDDDVVYRMLSGRLLKVFGCTIDTATDGRGAVDVLRMNLGKYDLVFMDIMMPKLDGIAATSLIRQFDEMTPIISVTSNSLPSEILTYYSSGMNDVLPKPFTKHGLYNILEKHLVHLKNIHEMSANSSPRLPIPALPPRILSTPSPSPRMTPHPEEGSGKENKEADPLPRPITPAYLRSTLAHMSPGLPGLSGLPSSSSLSFPSNNDATLIPTISPFTTYTSSVSPHPHDSPYLDLPQSPQSPQSQSSTLVDPLPDEDLHFSSTEFPAGSARSCAIFASANLSLRTQRICGVKRSLDPDDGDHTDEDERDHKRGKVD